MQIRWKSADKKTIQNFTGMVAFIDLSFGSSTKSGIHVVEYVKGKAKTKNSLKLNSSSELTFGKLPGHVRGLFEAHYWKGRSSGSTTRPGIQSPGGLTASTASRAVAIHA